MNAVDISVTSGHLVTNPSMNTIRNTYISVFLALYVVHCTASEQLASLASCSRQQSKIARNVLHEVGHEEAPCCFTPFIYTLYLHHHHHQSTIQYVFPHMARTEAPTLDKCLFHPNNDMYVWLVDAHLCSTTHQSLIPNHQHYNRLLKHEQHKQPLAHDHWRCGFCGKAFQTEAHLERHMTVHHADEVHPVGRHCLADYCDILHCDHFQARWNGQWPSPVDDGSCNVAQMQHVYGKCMVGDDRGGGGCLSVCV